MLKIKIAAAPEKGKANEALTAYLADMLKVRMKDISIISGHTSGIKQVKINNINKQTILDFAAGL